uniref:Fibronectin type-III domain-containing protein n=2 Tax=Picocystis salinarum TaxID=88271 RepID=A0A7S3UFP8_9CHLO
MDTHRGCQHQTAGRGTPMRYRKEAGVHSSSQYVSSLGVCAHFCFAMWLSDRVEREQETRAPLHTMAGLPKGMTWLALLLLLSQWVCINCVEEEALLLDDKDFCTVPGAADVSACDWIVDQLEDQNPDLTYDFFCSKKKDCDSQFVEGEVVDWFFGGCNGPKIVNRLCGCCVFTPQPVPPPVQPFRLRLALAVANCEAFDELAVVEAFCEAFIEEASFPDDTVCLTEDAGCAELTRKRHLLQNGPGAEAIIVLGGTFEGLTEDDAVSTADDILTDEGRLGSVNDKAVELLNERGTTELAQQLVDNPVTGGSSTAEEAEGPECTRSEDCQEPSAPVCVSNFCVACAPIAAPPVQGNCPEGELCALDGACMMPMSPGLPTNLAFSEVTTTSATITWNDGTMGFPLETYTVRCFEEEPEDCSSTDFATEVTGIPRGTEEATVVGLEANTEYLCFVIAINAVEPEGVCSNPLSVFIFTGVCTFIDPTIKYRQTFELNATGWIPFPSEQEIEQSSDFLPQFRGLSGVGKATYDGSITDGPFTRFGAESPGVAVNLLGDAENGFVTQIAIYLDVSEDAPFTDDTRFDWSVALSTDSEQFVQDFVFNAGFYDDDTGPGADERRFVVSGSNNAGRGSTFPKNPDKDPIAILQSGWYVFQHFFYKNGDEVFGELSIYSEDCLERVGNWTLGPAQIGGTGPVLLPGQLGFVRYGWFVQNELPSELLVLADQLLVFP